MASLTRASPSALLLHRVAYNPDHLHILHGPAMSLQDTRRLDTSQHQEETQDPCAAHGCIGPALEFGKPAGELEPRLKMAVA